MEKQLRAIRSWVRREGRLTEGQENALRNLWPTLGITASDQPINAEKLFGRKAPLILEIGFGNGLSLAAMAKAHPENDYIGAEVYLPGVAAYCIAFRPQSLRISACFMEMPQTFCNNKFLINRCMRFTCFSLIPGLNENIINGAFCSPLLFIYFGKN